MFYGMVAAWRLREWWPEDPHFQEKLQAAQRIGLVDLSREGFARSVGACFGSRGMPNLHSD